MSKYKITRTFSYEGKRYYIYGNTEREVAEKMAAKKLALENGKVIITSSVPLKEWAKECISTYKTNQGYETQKRYVSRMNHCILELIGDMPLNKIKAMHCQKVLNMQQGNSQRQINEVHQIMNFLFNKAVDNRLINDNPAKNLVKPSGYKHKGRALTEDEEQFLVPLLINERYRAFALMYYCGCRPTEARNCRFDDVLVKDGIKLLHIRGTKTERLTEASDRYVPIPTELTGIIGDGEGYIATDTRGNQLTSSSFRKAWAGLKKQMNIDMGCTVFNQQIVDPVVADDLVPYCLRHSFASRMVSSNVDIRLTSYMMGHSSITLTNDTYTHIGVNEIVQHLVQH